MQNFPCHEPANIRKGKMSASLNGMSTAWRFFQPACINPGQRTRHHAEVQMIGYRKWIPGLGFGTADIPLKLFETRLDFPSGSVIFNYLFYGQTQVGTKKRHPLCFAKNPDNSDRTLKILEHHDTVINRDCPCFAIKMNLVFMCSLLIFGCQ